MAGYSDNRLIIRVNRQDIALNEEKEGGGRSKKDVNPQVGRWLFDYSKPLNITGICNASDIKNL